MFMAFYRGHCWMEMALWQGRELLGAQSMHVSIHIYIYIYVYVLCIYTYVYTHMYIYIWVYKQVPFWALSASDCATEVPQASEQLGTFFCVWWTSSAQSEADCAQNVCEFPRASPHTPITQIPHKQFCISRRVLGYSASLNRQWGVVP